MRVKGSSMNRCSMLKLWVTEPVLIRVTREIDSGRSTLMSKLVLIVRLRRAADDQGSRGERARWRKKIGRIVDLGVGC